MYMCMHTCTCVSVQVDPYICVQVEHLVGLVDQTGLTNLDCLLLGGNAISDQGMRALASALARGGLPSCTTIELEGNPGDAAPVQEALAQRQK